MDILPVGEGSFERRDNKKVGLIWEGKLMTSSSFLMTIRGSTKLGSSTKLRGLKGFFSSGVFLEEIKLVVPKGEIWFRFLNAGVRD
jgi:hypothetical protein